MVHKGNWMSTFDVISKPRTIRTHLPVQLLPDEVWNKKPKIIYVSRHPKDVAISTYYFFKNYGCVQSLSTFLENFLNDEGFLSPYREHRLNYWNIPDYPKILYLTYELITLDIDAAIRKVSDFLEVSISNDNFEKLKDHLKFDKMKGTQYSNIYFR